MKNPSTDTVLLIGMLSDAHESRPSWMPFGTGGFTLPWLVLSLTSEP
jgi:hypothetical protein